MLTMLERAKAELLERVALSAWLFLTPPPGEWSPDEEEVCDFLHRYFSRTPPEDVLDQDPERLCDVALSHQRLARSRPPGTATVLVRAPEAAEEGGRTVVEVVTDELPFLLGAVTGVLHEAGRVVRLVADPRFTVRRDPEGLLADVLPAAPERGAGQALPADGLAESWIHVEIDALPDPADEGRLTTGLNRALADLRASVEDGPAMRGAALALADTLGALWRREP